MAHTKLLCVESFRAPDNHRSPLRFSLPRVSTKRCVCKAEDDQKRLLGEEGMKAVLCHGGFAGSGACWWGLRASYITRGRQNSWRHAAFQCTITHRILAKR